MTILENEPLKNYTTMHVGGLARYFIKVLNADELKQAIHFSKQNKLPVFLLGGGSNIVISDNGFNGLVIQFQNKGKKIIEETNDFVRIKVESGEILNDIINWTVENNWCGIENLSFVPGSISGLAV